MYNQVSNRNVDARTLYAEFTRKYDKNKAVFDKVVANFDGDGVKLKTGQDELEGGADTNDAQKTVDSMAKKAAKNLLKK